MYIQLWLTYLLVSLPVWTRADDFMRANIFLEDPILEDYGPPPATATVVLYDCSTSHRASPNTANDFQVYHNGQWWSQACPEHLVWNQTLCRCEYPGGQRPAVECRDYRPAVSGETGKYEQRVNGAWIQRDCSLTVAGLVWDQGACQCVWGPDSDRVITGQAITPCDVMLNITFDDGLQDHAKGSFVELARGNEVPLVALSGLEGFYSPRAAFFSDAALNIWHFADNEMGSSLRVEFTFKLEEDDSLRDKYQMILSNGCNVTKTGFTTPSLAIGYRPADQTYLLAFETSNTRKAIVCQRQLGAYNWHTVSLIYEDGTLLLRVDGQPCIISQDFTGSVQKTPCPLMLGADPLERQSLYRGYLDNVVIARYCRRYTDKEQPDELNVPKAVPEDDLSNSNSNLEQDRGRLYGNQPYLGSFNDDHYSVQSDPEQVNTAGSLGGPRGGFNDVSVNIPVSDHVDDNFNMNMILSPKNKARAPWYERNLLLSKREHAPMSIDKTQGGDITGNVMDKRNVLTENEPVDGPNPQVAIHSIEDNDEKRWLRSDQEINIVPHTVSTSPPPINVGDKKHPWSDAISQGMMMKGARRIGRRQPRWFERPTMKPVSSKAIQMENLDKNVNGIIEMLTETSKQSIESIKSGQNKEKRNNYEGDEAIQQEYDYKIMPETPEHVLEERIYEISNIGQNELGFQGKKKMAETAIETNVDEWYTDDIQLPEDFQGVDHMNLLLKYPPYNGREFEKNELKRISTTE